MLRRHPAFAFMVVSAERKAEKEKEAKAVVERDASTAKATMERDAMV